jgi:fungal nitric oxide reductase
MSPSLIALSDKDAVADPTGQIIYTILGVPFEDLEFLTHQNAIRSNGSGTVQEAAAANQ